LLLRIDLEERWRRRNFILLEQYLDRFPDLGSGPELPATLILEEYRIRHQFGDQPLLAAYQRRFPAQFSELKRLLEGDDFPTLTPDSKKPTRAADRSPASSQVLPISAE